MKHDSAKMKPFVNNRLVAFMIVMAVIAGLPLLAYAFARSSSSVDITIVNNSNLEFRHVYLSPVDRDNWGPDQLNGSVIRPGASYTLSNVSCEGSNIKVIAEDQNGCFLYHVVSCAENSTWSVSNTDTPDCGN